MYEVKVLEAGSHSSIVSCIKSFLHGFSKEVVSVSVYFDPQYSGSNKYKAVIVYK